MSLNESIVEDAALEWLGGTFIPLIGKKRIRGQQIAFSRPPHAPHRTNPRKAD